MNKKDSLKALRETQLDVVTLDLNIEVLEHRVELIAAAGACTSSSSSCSNINIELSADAVVAAA